MRGVLSWFLVASRLKRPSDPIRPLVYQRKIQLQRAVEPETTLQDQRLCNAVFVGMWYHFTTSSNVSGPPTRWIGPGSLNPLQRNTPTELCLVLAFAKHPQPMVLTEPRENGFKVPSSIKSKADQDPA